MRVQRHVVLQTVFWFPEREFAFDVTAPSLRVARWYGRISVTVTLPDFQCYEVGKG